MNSDAMAGITEAEIADYLVHTPAFFERHAELLGTIQLASPHGNRAVSLQQRQMDLLRDKIKGLEQRLVEMIRHGQENVAIADKLHRWTRRLMQTPRPADLPEVVVEGLQEAFLIPQAAVRVWDVAPAYAGAAFARGASADARSLAASLTLPYCGPNASFEAAGWLDDGERATSIALIALRDARRGAFGLLVLASPDPTRFSPDMGVDFLVRIGEIAGAALARLLPEGG